MSEQAAPWAEVEAYVPSGYELTPQGVLCVGRRGNSDWIADPCWISATTRSTEGSNAGVIVCWMDRQTSRVRELATPNRRFHETSNALVQQLADAGLQVVPGSERAVLKYLGSFRLPLSAHIRSVHRLGWVADDDDRPLFVLPDQTIGIECSGRPTIVFQSEEPIAKHIAPPAGSLMSWQRHVAKPCESHPFLLFALCAAFAGPLMRLARLDSGGFHFHGASSKGKTTLLQVAASVWGNGADSAVSHDSYLTRWNSTANAFEATAAAYNDLLLPLDELGTCDARDVGQVIYNLFGGRGKNRLNKESALRPHRTWQILALSTGEISLAQKAKEESSRQAHAGQLARMVDIRIPNRGVVEVSEVTAARDFVQSIKLACGRTFGVAGPAFLERLVDEFCLPPDSQRGAQSFSRLGDSVVERLDLAERELAVRGLETHHARVIRRIAIVMLGGLLANELNVLPLDPARIRDACTLVRDTWLADDDNVAEEIRGTNGIREFILLNEGRFREAKSSDHVVHNLEGYKTSEPGSSRRLFLFTPEKFGAICQRYRCDSKRVAIVLKARSLLFVNDTNRLTSKHTVEGVGRPSFYAVRASIVDDPDRAVEPDGHRGS